MLYLGIDQHRKQLTVSIRNEAGDVVLRRQISTEWDRVRAFFDELRRNAEAEGGVAAIVEVCGFNDWLLKMLTEYGCRETVLIQVEKRSKRKTDRRDAHQLSGTLWVNRGRLLAGQRVVILIPGTPYIIICDDKRLVADGRRLRRFDRHALARRRRRLVDHHRRRSYRNHL